MVFCLVGFAFFVFFSSFVFSIIIQKLLTNVFYKLPLTFNLIKFITLPLSLCIFKCLCVYIFLYIFFFINYFYLFL